MSVKGNIVEEASIPLKASASHLYNNLSSNGSSVSYVHGSEVQIFNESCIGTKKPFVNKVLHIQESSSGGAWSTAGAVTQAKFCEIGRNPSRYFLVVTSATSVQMFESETYRVTFSYTLAGNASEATRDRSNSISSGSSVSIVSKNSFTSITSIISSSAETPSHVLIGSSSGEVFVFAISKEIILARTLKQHECPITALSSDNSTWCSADQQGTITVWKHMEVVQTFKGCGTLITSTAIKGDYVYAVGGNGTLCIYSISQGALLIEALAHSQIINSIAVHPTQDLIATVADDSLVSLWRLSKNAPLELNLVNSISVANSLLCGVRFCGDQSLYLAVTAYDSAALFLYKINPL